MKNKNSFTDSIANSLYVLGTVSADSAVMTSLDKYPGSALVVGIEKKYGCWCIRTGIYSSPHAPHLSEEDCNYILQHIGTASEKNRKVDNILYDIIPSVVNRMCFMCRCLDACMNNPFSPAWVSFRLYKEQGKWFGRIQIRYDDNCNEMDPVEIGSVA